ncbi:MAG: transcriptional regulator [Betaproteobacteria bacterium]
MPKQAVEILLEQERYELKQKSGGGRMRFEVWGYVRSGKTVVTRYNIAYINHAVFAKDNGRVLGYDNAHGYLHRHYMGKVEAYEFVSYEATVDRFQIEWSEIIKRLKK